MKIIRFCGRSISDVYCVLTSDNWELGMPEGLAHWNGSSWRWLARKESGFVQELKLAPKGLLWLNVDGSITTFEYSGTRSVIDGPAYDANVHPRAGIAAPCFYSFSPLDDGSFVVVGDYGLIYAHTGHHWRRVNVLTDRRLNQIVAQRLGCYYVAGMNGTLLRFDGERAEALDIDRGENVLRIGVGHDGTTYLLVNSGDDFAFCQLAENQVINKTAIKRDALAIRVIEENRIVYSSYDGVFLWNGPRAVEQCLLSDLSGQIEHIGEVIAVSLKRDGLPAILFNHRNWQTLKVALDEAYIE